MALSLACRPAVFVPIAALGKPKFTRVWVGVLHRMRLRFHVAYFRAFYCKMGASALRRAASSVCSRRSSLRRTSNTGHYASIDSLVSSSDRNSVFALRESSQRTEGVRDCCPSTARPAPRGRGSRLSSCYRFSLEQNQSDREPLESPWTHLHVAGCDQPHSSISGRVLQAV